MASCQFEKELYTTKLCVRCVRQSLTHRIDHLARHISCSRRKLWEKALEKSR